MNRDTRYDEIFLFFEEKEHKYTDSKGNNYMSVTTLIHNNYVPEFDKEYWLRRKAKELNIPKAKLAQQWKALTDEACNRGTLTHNGIEDAIKEVSMFKEAIKHLDNIKSGRMTSVADIPNLNVKPLDIEKFKIATENKYEDIYKVFQVYIDNGYKIYSEIGAYLIDYLISGTIDVLCIRETDFVILDWKTNRNGLQFTSGYFKQDKSSVPHQLTKEYVETKTYMKAPLNKLPDCNGSHYTMQLSIYALMVEIILGIPCTKLGLCHIGHPFVKNKYGMPLRTKDNKFIIDPNGKDTIKWYTIPYLKEEASAVLKDRYLKLQSDKLYNQPKQLKLF